jgi:hypothetical protein
MYSKLYTGPVQTKIKQSNVFYREPTIRSFIKILLGVLEIKYTDMTPHMDSYRELLSHKKTLWLLVRKRTVPTKRPPLVGEVGANFLRIEGVAWLGQRIPTAVNLGFIDRNFFQIMN